MIRIYLDKNILNHLKNFPDGPFSRRLEELKDYSVIPYSRAHLSDLCKGYADLSEEIKSKVHEDLELLSELSNNYYLNWNHELNFVDWFVKSTHDNFKSELEVYGASALDSLRILFDPQEDSDDPLDSLMKSLGSLLDSMPLAIDFDEMTGTDEGKVFLKMYPNAAKTGLLGDFMRDMLAWVDSIDANPSSYKELRSMVMLHTGVSNSSSNIHTDVIEQLDEILKPSILGKSFDQIVESGNNNDKSTYEDEFRNQFVMLDMVGYRTDRLKKGYTNFLNDCQHAFFASHCDFFVTEDLKTLDKAKAIYEKRQITTRACNIEEFLNFTDSLDFTLSKEVILHPEKLSGGHQLMKHQEKDGITLDTFYLQKRFYNFYNVLDILKSNSVETTYTFQHVPENESRSYSFQEIERQLNYLHTVLGADFKQRVEYNADIDTPKIRGRKWGGRKWEFECENISIYYNFLESDNFPRLVIVKNSHQEMVK